MRKKFTLSKIGLICLFAVLTTSTSYGQIISYTSATTGALSSVAANATGTALARVNGATAPGAPCGTGFSSDAFTSTTTYSATLPAIEVTVTPASGYALNVTGFTADMRRSSTGPASVRYAYSTDGGTTWINQGSNQSPNNASCGTTTTGTWNTTVSVLAPGVLKFRVYGFNASGSTGTFQILNLKVNGTVSGSCPAPLSLSATSVTSSSATLNWTDSGIASSYNIQYRKTGTTTWSATTATVTHVSVSGLLASSTYEFQVQSVCGSGSSSAYTASGTFTTSAASSCPVPSGLSASSITASTATLNWGAASGAVSYNIQYRQTGTTTWTSTTATSTSKAISGLSSGATYEFQVQTVCSGSSTSAFSGSATFSTTGSSGCDPSLWSHVYNSSRLTVNQSCVTITGTVANKISEADGDIHIRVTVDAAYSYMLNNSNVSGQHGDMVVEPVCTHTITQADAVSACTGFSNTVYIPNVGEHVVIVGAYVTDQNHGWNEIHPVTSITVGAPHPSGGSTTAIDEPTGIFLSPDDIKVFPNPANSGISFTLGQKPSSVVYITLVDEMGRVAGQYQMLETKELKAATNYFPNGKYYYSVTQDGRLVKGGTFIVKH